ncbi:hypothetical protein S83_036030 [Arachis hypogaea]
MAEKESDVGEKQVPQNDKNEEGNNGKNNNNKGKKVMEEEDSAYGPWMMVQRTNRGKKAGKVQPGEGSGGAQNAILKIQNQEKGTRFAILSVAEEENHIIEEGSILHQQSMEKDTNFSKGK